MRRYPPIALVKSVLLFGSDIRETRYTVRRLLSSMVPALCLRHCDRLWRSTPPVLQAPLAGFTSSLSEIVLQFGGVGQPTTEWLCRGFYS